MEAVDIIRNLAHGITSKEDSDGVPKDEVEYFGSLAEAEESAEKSSEWSDGLQYNVEPINFEI